MATIPMALQQIRRARRAVTDPPPASQFETNRPSYEATLVAAHELAGEEGLDHIVDWATSWTQSAGQFPDPETFEDHCRRILCDRGIEIPADSPLADADD